MANANTNVPIVPAFDFAAYQIGGYSPLPQAVVTAGSNLGVPPNNSVANETPQSNSGASAVSYGQSSVQRGVLYQPVFWAVVLLAISVVMFGHMAHVEIRA